MTTGSIGILSVGTGDTKLTFDRNNPAECIRAARIITDMLKRGYALLVEVERNGVKAYERVQKFRADTFEYIIADFDPTVAEPPATVSIDEERTHEEAVPPAAPTPAEAQPVGRPRGRPKGIKSRSVDATGAKAIAVAHTAGG